MSKISQKMYSALMRGGIPQDVARRFAENVEFLGESTQDSNERDNYDILLCAKALSSLVKRHKDTTPIMPRMDSDISTDMTRVNTPVKPVAEVKSAPERPKPQRREKASSLLQRIKRTSPATQKFLANFLPFVWYLLIVLLFVLCIGAAILSIGAVIGTTVGGIILFFTGMLYGVSQLSLFSGAALFEIGLAFVIGGFAVALSVLIFNFLTRSIPFFLKQGTRELLKLNSEMAALRGELASKADTNQRKAWS